MKRIKLLSLSFICFSLLAQESKPSWDYPFKPGSEKWKELKSHQEMVAICQIPENIIHLLSTEDLINICLDYPLFFTLTAFNNMQEGYEQVSTEFNGFKELIQRKDFGKLMLKNYKSINTFDINNLSTDLSKGKFIFRIFYLELMLSQNNSLDNLDVAERKDLLKEGIIKAKEKQQANSSLFQIQLSYLLMGRILNFEKYENFIKKFSSKNTKYDLFLRSVRLTDTELLIEIGRSATDFIEQSPN